MHCGTKLYVDGELDGDVYMTRPPIQSPWPKPLEGKPGPALKLLPLLQTWKWVRPEIDPILFLGWQGAAMLAGALGWRPTIFITGGHGTGKSTLHDIMHLLHGEALIHSADTTAAGIYQKLKADALPVAVDEIEGKDDNRRAKAIMELARAAASGALILRGGDRHQGTNFFARSCFAFSSINTPPLEPQDLSRMALLRLQRLGEEASPPKLDAKELYRLGRMIRRRLIENWERFPGTLAAYREAMADAGHDSRGQDTFGTLLACADLIIDTDAADLGVPMGPDTEDLRFWSEQFTAADMFELEDADDNWRKCVDRVLTARVEAWRQGTRSTVGEVIESFRRNQKGAMDALNFEEANVWLGQAGLKLQKPTTANDEFTLFIPNQHPLIQELFKDSNWYGQKGAGVWSGALRQAPPHYYVANSARVTGAKCKGTQFPLSVVMQDEGE